MNGLLTTQTNQWSKSVAEFNVLNTTDFSYVALLL